MAYTENQQENLNQQKESREVWIKRCFSTVIDKEGKKKRHCRAENCEVEYSYATSQTHLKKHWNNHEQNNKTMPATYSFHVDKVLDLVIKYVLLDNQEYTTVESHSFRELLRAINPNQRMMTRHTLSDILNSKTNDKMSLIKQKLASTVSVALTADLWTPRKSCRSFGAITCHYVDEKMKLQSLILEFKKINYPHDAVTLRNFVLETIETFDLRKKVIAITSDNASSNI